MSGNSSNPFPMDLTLPDAPLTIGDAARALATRAPEQVLCRRGDRALSASAVDEQANRLANALLARGFIPGDRAAVLMPARPETLIAVVAVARVGGISQMLMPQYGAVQLVEMLRLAPPKWLFFAEEQQEAADAIRAAFAPETVAVGQGTTAQTTLAWSTLLAGGAGAPPAITVRPADDALLFFTSGTTGTAKAVARSHNSALTHGALLNHYAGFTAGSRMAYMEFRYEEIGQILASGGCFLLVPSMQARAWLQTIAAERVTHLFLIPSLLDAWLSYPDWAAFDLSALRCVMVGGMSTRSELFELARERFGFPLLQVYGSMETGMLAVNDLRDGMSPSAIGRPVVGKEVAIFEEGQPVPPGAVGELVARPAGPFECGFTYGYYGSDESPWRDGWLHTGDLMVQNEQGNLFMVGRTYETINVAGHKVYAPEVERVLRQHPAVAEAAVIGQADRRRGEVVVAFIILEPEATDEGQTNAPDELSAALRQHCRAQLAEHKVPRQIVLRNRLPRTATGKIDKQALGNESA